MALRNRRRGGGAERAPTDTPTTAATLPFMLPGRVRLLTGALVLGLRGGATPGIPAPATDQLFVTPLETVRVTNPNVDQTRVGTRAVRTSVGAARTGHVWSRPAGGPMAPIDRSATVTLANVGAGIIVTRVTDPGGAAATDCLAIVGLTAGYWTFDVQVAGTLGGAYTRTITVPVLVEPGGTTAIRPRRLPDDAWVHPESTAPTVTIANTGQLLALNTSTTRGTVYLLSQALYDLGDTTFQPAAPSGSGTGLTYFLPATLYAGIQAGTVTPAEVERRITDGDVAGLATIRRGAPEHPTAVVGGGSGWRWARVGITAAEITNNSLRVYELLHWGNESGATDADCGINHGLFGCAVYGVFDYETLPQAVVTRSVAPTTDSGAGTLTLTLAAPAPATVPTGGNGVGVRVRLRKPGRAARYDQGAYYVVGTEGVTGAWGAFRAVSYTHHPDGTGTLALTASNNDYGHGSDFDPSQLADGAAVEFWNPVRQHFRRGVLSSGARHVLRGCRVKHVQVQHDNDANDYDSQAFAFFNGSGAHAVVDCAITGPATELTCVGGSGASGPSMVPRDILFDRVFASRAGYAARCSGGLWNTKNLHENKTGDGIEQYRCWYAWNPPGDLNQPGYAFVHKTQPYLWAGQADMYPEQAAGNYSVRDTVVDQSVGAIEFSGYQQNGEEPSTNQGASHDLELDNVLFMRCLESRVANKAIFAQIGLSYANQSDPLKRLRDVRLSRVTHIGRWPGGMTYPVMISLGPDGGERIDRLTIAGCALRASSYGGSPLVLGGIAMAADDDQAWATFVRDGAFGYNALFDAASDTSQILGGTNVRRGGTGVDFVGDVLNSTSLADYALKPTSPLKGTGPNGTDPVADVGRLAAQIAGVAEVLA